MDILKNILLFYLILINLTALALCGIDKYLAVKNKRRIPEAALFTVSFLLGSPCMLIGMYLFNHKVKKAKFFIGVPCIIALQTALAAYLYFRGVL